MGKKLSGQLSKFGPRVKGGEWNFAKCVEVSAVDRALAEGHSDGLPISVGSVRVQ